MEVCDHSDLKRVAVLGTLHVDVDDRSLTGKYVIPIMDVKFPSGAGYRRDVESHDFALMVLQHPAKWSDKGVVDNNIYPSINLFLIQCIQSVCQPQIRSLEA